MGIEGWIKKEKMGRLKKAQRKISRLQQEGGKEPPGK